MIIMHTGCQKKKIIINPDGSSTGFTGYKCHQHRITWFQSFRTPVECGKSNEILANSELLIAEIMKITAF
jgi:hypothetical protein